MLLDLSISNDSKILACGGLDDKVLLFSIPSGELLGTLIGHGTSIGSLGFTPDGKYLVVSNITEIKVWEVTGWKEKITFKHTGVGQYPIAISPDSKTVAIGIRKAVEFQNSFLLFSIKNGKLTREFKAGDKQVSSRYVKKGDKVVQQVSLKKTRINDVKFSHNGRILAGVTSDRHIKVIEL